MNIKKPKVNKNVIAKISQNEYKNVLFNKNMFKTFDEQNHSIVMSLNSLSCFIDKIDILNGIDALALGYKS